MVSDAISCPLHNLKTVWNIIMILHSYVEHEDGRTAPGVRGNGPVPLSHSGNVVTRIGIHTHTYTLCRTGHDDVSRTRMT